MSQPNGKAATQIVGIVANPASGKDVRRLTARASVFDNQEKAAIVRRCLAGIAAFQRQGREQEGCGNAVHVRYLADSHNIVSSAAEETGIAATRLDIEATGTAADTAFVC